MHPITVYSFGYLHPWPEGVPRPSEEDTHDLRELLADPAHVPGEDMRDRTGLDLDVADERNDPYDNWMRACELAADGGLISFA